jgi:hypothetical protein
VIIAGEGGCIDGWAEARGDGIEKFADPLKLEEPNMLDIL